MKRYFKSYKQAKKAYDIAVIENKAVYGKDWVYNTYIKTIEKPIFFGLLTEKIYVVKD